MEASPELFHGLRAGEGRNHHPSKTLIGPPSLPLLRTVAARGQVEKTMNSRSLRPGPVRGVGVSLPPPTDAETRDLKQAHGVLWDTHPTDTSWRSLGK